MKKHDDDNEITDEEIEEQSDEETSDVDKDDAKDDATKDDTAESDDEDSYVETVLNDVFGEYENTIKEHVPEPDTIEEYSKNSTIINFVRDKIIDKFAEDFHARNSWNSMDITSKWTRLARKRMVDDDVDDSTAMKRVLRSNGIIEERVKEHIEEMENEEDEGSDNDE